MVAALIADGFRNYLRAGHRKSAEELLVERANMLTLTAPEMTVLVGGMQTLNAKQISTVTRILAEVIASIDRRCKFS
jgi:catalase (peroxidase I)